MGPYENNLYGMKREYCWKTCKSASRSRKTTTDTHTHRFPVLGFLCVISGSGELPRRLDSRSMHALQVIVAPAVGVVCCLACAWCLGGRVCVAMRVRCPF